MRFQLALNVQDLQQSIDYYSKMFNASPHKVKPGYANFAINNPPLKLVLIENDSASERINHLGVEVGQHEDLNGIINRLDVLEMTDKKEQETTCCYATQNKAWTLEPEGIRWEWYTITDDNPENAMPLKNGSCCVTVSSTDNCN